MMKCPLTGLPLDAATGPCPTPAAALPPLWRLGFRPFFLCGAAFAAGAIGLWIFVYAGGALVWEPLGGWLGWHRHEMPFGFALAIVAGFLLTAVPNWTGQPGVRGWPLALLLGLWGAARLLWLAGAPWWLVAVPDVLWLPLLAGFLVPSLKRTRQMHNYPVLVMLALLALANALAFAGLARGDAEMQRNAAFAAIWLIAALMTMIGGRVIPFFTRNALGLPAVATTTPTPLRALLPDLALMALTLLVAANSAAGLLSIPALPLAILFGLLTLGHARRLWRWHHRGIWRVALLWPLHVSYGWMLLACGALALFHAGLLPRGFSHALHALTVGAMGGLILAMIVRVSLAHTGRALQAPRTMHAAFLLFHLGAAARVFLAFWLPRAGLLIAAICWIAAFALFVAVHGPMLCRPRVDGKPG
ncbi:MAG: NnrS family protein [Burkholderiaceae bacterium]|jgi:uncharacterized protein involved in response to NO|nr:NnrS family protein [Burkholderiaceae bacterium]